MDPSDIAGDDSPTKKIEQMTNKLGELTLDELTTQIMKNEPVQSMPNLNM